MNGQVCWRASISTASARALEDALRENGFRTGPLQPFIERLRRLGQGTDPITLETAAEFLPPGLLTNSIRKTRTAITSRPSLFMAQTPTLSKWFPTM